MIRIDYHVHSEHSPDAEPTIFNVCQAAVDAGIDEIAITDHLIVVPGDEYYGAIDFERQAREIADAQDKFNTLAVIWGAEVSYQRDWESQTRQLLEDIPFDFVIGSVHLVADYDYSCPIQVFKLAKTLDPVAACTPYYRTVKRAAQSRLFDVIGHIDLVKRHGIAAWERWSEDMFSEMIDSILVEMIESQTLLEINTSGLRQSPGVTFPSTNVIKRYSDLGGRLVTVGSDSHCLDDVGRDIGVALRLAEEHGLTVTRFRRRRPIDGLTVHRGKA